PQGSMQTSPPARCASSHVSTLGGPPATMALGARVVVEAGGRRHTRWNLPGSTGLAGSGPSRVHIGLGDVDVVDRIEVRWPTGELEVREGVAARQRLVLREGG
ncbi:MAG: ASPIC/UnbV domain-containing protein, partial [bacterium]